MTIITDYITAADLIAFEDEVKQAFLAGHIRAPVHLSAGNEQQLINIFRNVERQDWVFSTWRSHYHALLKGIPREWIMRRILDGASMYLNSPEHRFVASSIVGGTLPIALGVAMGTKRRGGSERIWVFVGDMTAETGIFHEVTKYAAGHGLPMRFVVEDNGLSTNTPTDKVWGYPMTKAPPLSVQWYHYTRECPHVGVGQFVTFG